MAGPTPTDGSRHWFGYGDFEFYFPEGGTCISFAYEWEPPHGDSLHKVTFSNIELAGFAWGNGLAWSPCGRYVLFDYSPDRRKLTRVVVVLDVEAARTFILPDYVAVSRFRFPHIYERAAGQETVTYAFRGDEEWRDVA